MTTSRDATEVIGRRHPEWCEHQARWRWLLDSLEGGERYRHAVYGYDRRGFPLRNLVRHKREYPDPRELSTGNASLNGFGMQLGPSSDAANGNQSTDDDYELRRARTPIPTFIAEAIDTHLSRIFAREVKRIGPPTLTKWWNSVDGCGTTIDQWMTETIAPLLLALGQLDIYMDHPRAPKDAVIETRADMEQFGLDRCIATHILPENMLWWRLDEDGKLYEECLVLEHHETDQGTVPRFRHWTGAASILYDDEGQQLSITPHPFGRVPIIRVFDRRKPRCRNIGQSRYEGVAERQREYYNRDSELILSDTTQAHPLLQGPEDFVQADGTIPIGPSWLLPKPKSVHSGSVSYEGFEVVNFPKDGAESIRKNKADLRDEVDRDSALVHRVGRDAVSQSGLSKALDHIDGNNRLSKIAKTLARTERVLSELASLVIHDGTPPELVPLEVQILYPTEFDLFTATDMAKAVGDFQSLVLQAGSLPTTEGLLLSRLLRLCMPGMSDDQYAICDTEISTLLSEVDANQKRKTGHADLP